MEEQEMWPAWLVLAGVVSWHGFTEAVAAAPNLLAGVERIGGAYENAEKGPGGATAAGGSRKRSQVLARVETSRDDTAPARDENDRGRVDLNQCSFEDLLRLPGIGPKKAKAILQERERRPFRSIHDLRRVKGIGAKTVQRLAPFVTAGPMRARD